MCIAFTNVEFKHSSAGISNNLSIIRFYLQLHSLYEHTRIISMITNHIVNHHLYIEPAVIPPSHYYTITEIIRYTPSENDKTTSI